VVEEYVNDEPMLNQPAGHVEEGENPLQAAIRETLEETGWDIELMSLLGIYRWVHPDKQETFFRFTFIARALQQRLNARLDHGIIGPLWLTEDEIQARHAQLRSPMILQSIREYKSGISYPLSVLRDMA